MNILLSLPVLVVFFVIVIYFILWGAWHRKAENIAPYAKELPFVSILLAVRNEKPNLPDTLNSLKKLDYPADKLEILLGDDQSDDGSSDILKEWAQAEPNFSYIQVEEGNGKLKGKANVLAQLAKQAKGDFFFITDADAEVPSSWLRKNLACWKPGSGIQSGFTLIKQESFFSSMQMIDWGLALGMVKIVSGWKIPVTGVGNNMMVSREAYEAIGGYEQLPTTITEDFTLFQAIAKNGFGYQQLANEESLVQTKAVNSYKELLNQRKRWMTGAMQLPFFMKTLLFLQALYFPSMALMLFLNPLLAIPLFGLKITLQSLFLNKVFERLNRYVPLGHLFMFEFYCGIISMSLLIYYLLPSPVIWKGRVYPQ